MKAEALTEALRETLAQFDPSAEPRTTTEVADNLDLGRRSTYNRLERLVEHDRLETKKVGANARVWWRPPATAPATPEWPAAAESLVEAVEEYAIFTLDPEGHVRTWNRGAERIKGYEGDEIVGEHVSAFYTEADREAGVPERNLAAAAEDGSIEDEGWRVRADGSRFWANVTITAIRDEDGEIEGYAKVTRDMTDRREREHQLRRERDLIDQLFDTAPVRLVVFDTDGSVERTNSRARREIGVDPSDGRISDSVTLLDADGESLPAEDHPVQHVIETAEPITNREVQYETPTGERRWASLTASPLFDEEGTLERVIVAGKDITARKEKERRLARQRDELQHELDDVFERIDDAFCALDDELRFEYVNDRAEELLDFSERELLGRTVWDALSVADDDPIRERFRTAMATQEPTSFERYSEPLGLWEIVRVYPSESGLSVYFTDVTERKERERELEEYRRWTQTLIENVPNGAVALVDEDLRYVTFGGTPEGDTDLTRADLEGQSVREVLPNQIAEVVVPAYEAALAGESSEFEETIDGRVYQFHFVPVRDDDGEVFAATATSQDVTERKEREDLLREIRSRLEAATEAGAVGTWEWHVPDDELVMGASLAQMVGMDPDAARGGVSVDQFISAIHEEDRERVERAVDDAVTSCGEYREEYRVRNADDEYRWVVARGHVECDDAGDPVTFPGALVDITERKRAERELERRREQLAAMNGLNEVVRDIAAAIVEQSTREEIEETVCERLAATDSYLFAWTGEVDPASGTVALRTEAGVDGYLDGITVSVDPDEARSEGPTGRALRTGETQVTHDVRADSRYEPWRDHVDQYGFRSSAAIPITHEDTVYGVLNVYADRPHAFEGQERAVVSQLGEVVGHAIAAAERKQALLSDELVELDFRVSDVFAAVGAPVETSGTITLDHAVPAGDGEFLVYGTATPDAIDTVRGLVEALPNWESVTVVAEDDPLRFELRVIDAPVLSAVTSRGGYVDEAVIEDGDYRMTIHLAPSIDVREVTDAVEAAYPQSELLRRQQISQSRNESRQLQRRLAADLTDRQRSALEAAYHAGFFRWPRETTGERIAESLGIAPPTFHQHLRKAQQRAFDALLSPSIPGTTA